MVAEGTSNDDRIDAGAAPVIEASDLRFSYGGAFRLQLDRLAVVPRRHAACIGPSGCGKTTLLRLLTGILLPREGTVSVDGQCLSSMSDRQRRAFRVATIGMVFQHFALLEYLSAAENILLPYRINRALRITSETRERVEALAEATGIRDVLQRRPRRLSHGERQRVAICRALVTRPRVIVCDEPTGNLDPNRSRATLELILREADRAEATVLMVTHDHGLLDAFDQVIDLAPGDAP